MLGLANTVSSGSTLESLYSITLDGTDDYIDLGTGISLGTGDFTISLWVKTADFHDKAMIGEFELASPQDFWYFGASNQDPPTLLFRHRVADDDAVSIYTGSSISLDDHKNAWTHIAISADRDGKIEGYVNGVKDTADVDAADPVVNLTIPANTQIGLLGTSNFAFQIDEVSIWNTPLDSNTIEAIYNKGANHDLTSGLSIGTGPLVAYYRMGNGTFDDKANGVVHDQHAPGFGSELVTSWTNTDFDEFTSSGSNITEMVSGADKDNCYASATTTSGKTYKLQFVCSQNITAQVRISSSVNLTGGLVVLSNPTSGLNTAYFRADASYTKIGFFANDTFTDTQISDFTFKELNGIPGLTSGGPTFSSDVP